MKILANIGAVIACIPSDTHKPQLDDAELRGVERAHGAVRIAHVGRAPIAGQIVGLRPGGQLREK